MSDSGVLAFPRPIRTLRGLLASQYLVLGLSVLYFFALLPFTPGLASPNNLANILLTLMPLLIVAMGQTVVLISGGIDLSVTSIIALTSVCGAMVMDGENGWLAGHPLALPAGLGAMLLLGAVVGLANGIAIARLRMPPFIVTLTGMMFFSGWAIWMTKSKNIGHLPPAFNALGGNTWIAFALTTVLALAMHVMLSRSLFGRWLYAVGHNARAAHISGVPVPRVLIATYATSGFCAAAAGVLLTGQAETGSPVLGQRILLDVIGATVIGGTSLFGGRGRILWTVFGVLFIKLIDNSLNLLGLSHFIIMMVKGGVILLAALMDSLRHRIAGGAT